MFRPLFAPRSLAVLLISICSCSQETPVGTATDSRVAAADAVATANAETQSTSQSVDFSGAVQLRQVDIPDPARGNQPAYRLLVPKDWEVEGGFTAPASAFHMIPYYSQFAVRAPDGRGAMFWGMLEFGYADGASYPLFAPLDGRPFFPRQTSLGDYWLRTFELAPTDGVTNLEIVSEVVLPDATKHVRKLLAPLYESTRQENAQLAATRESKQFDVEARQLVLRYKDHGKRIEATVFATLRNTCYRYPGGAVRAGMWNIDHMYAVFGPVGSEPLNDPVLAAVVRSRSEVPEWQEAVQRWYLEKNQQIVREGAARIAAAARSAAIVRTTESQDILDISFQGWKNRDAANSAGHTSSVNGILERTTYATGSGTTLDLPSHYQNVYADGQGNYVLHNDANYEINTDPAFNAHDWQRIEAQ